MAESKKYQISARAVPQFIADQSDPANERYVFAYTITIENVGTVPAQLISRHWIITDGNGKVQEVEGEGVVGEQPLIPPGGEFQYTSGAILETPLGTMEGHYEMVDHQGQPFQTAIPVFRLAIPTLIH